MDKAVVLIDGGYIDRIRENKPSIRIDYLKLSEKVCEDCERVRTYYYHCMPYQSNPPTKPEKKNYQGMQKLLYTLNRLPKFDYRLGKLGRRTCPDCKAVRPIQKRVDIMMAIEMVALSFGGRINRIKLITGDSDLVPAVEVAKASGTIIELYYSKESVHDELLDEVDYRHEIDEDFINSILRE